MTDEEYEEQVQSGVEAFREYSSETRIAILSNVQQLLKEGVTVKDAIITIMFIREIMHFFVGSMIEHAEESDDFLQKFAANAAVNAWCGLLEAKSIMPLLHGLCEEARTATM
jgi:hypothetical protein